VSSTVNGIEIQFSQDNLNWDITVYDNYSNNVAYSKLFQIQSQYYRLIYRSDSEEEDELRIKSILHPRITDNTNKLDTSNDNTSTIAQNTASIGVNT